MLGGAPPPKNTISPGITQGGSQRPSDYVGVTDKTSLRLIEEIEKKEIKQQFEKLKKTVTPKVYINQSIDEEVKEPELHWAALTAMICGILGCFLVGVGIIFNNRNVLVIN